MSWDNYLAPFPFPLLLCFNFPFDDVNGLSHSESEVLTVVDGPSTFNCWSIPSYFVEPKLYGVESVDGISKV